MRLKFVCLNLWYGGKLWEPMLGFLQREQPDILAAQEVYDARDASFPPRFRSLERLRADLELPHAFFSAAFGDVTPHGTLPCGNAIFSRFPITGTQTIFFDVPFRAERDEEKDRPDFTRTPRNLQHVVVDVGGNLFNIYNTQGIWGFDGKDNPRRLAMAERIVDEVAGKEHVVLAGDFNVREETKTIGLIEKELVNVFKGERETSFNMRHKSGGDFSSAVVDFVFVSADVRALEHAQPAVNVSDHLPLVCTLAVGP